MSDLADGQRLCSNEIRVDNEKPAHLKPAAAAAATAADHRAAAAEDDEHGD